MPSCMIKDAHILYSIQASCLFLGSEHDTSNSWGKKTVDNFNP